MKAYHDSNFEHIFIIVRKLLISFRTSSEKLVKIIGNKDGAQDAGELCIPKYVSYQFFVGVKKKV